MLLIKGSLEKYISLQMQLKILHAMIMKAFHYIIKSRHYFGHFLSIYLLSKTSRGVKDFRKTSRDVKDIGMNSRGENEIGTKKPMLGTGTERERN